MADTFSLRVYSYIDRMQPQYAAFVGTVTQGDLPTEGMAALYIEVAPGNEVFRLVDIAVKSTEAKPGAQIVEREFGIFEVHSPAQSEVLEAGRIVLDRLNLHISERVKPAIASVQIITNVDPYQAQVLNRFRRGSMLVPGETMLEAKTTVKSQGMTINQVATYELVSVDGDRLPSPRPSAKLQPIKRSRIPQCRA